MLICSKLFDGENRQKHDFEQICAVTFFQKAFGDLISFSNFKNSLSQSLRVYIEKPHVLKLKKGKFPHIDL